MYGEVPSAVEKMWLHINAINGLDWSLLVKHLELEIYTTLGYIVLLILLNLGHVFRFRIVESETRVPSSKGIVKQYNQELCIPPIHINALYVTSSACGSLESLGVTDGHVSLLHVSIFFVDFYSFCWKSLEASIEFMSCQYSCVICKCSYC